MAEIPIIFNAQMNTVYRPKPERFPAGRIKQPYPVLLLIKFINIIDIQNGVVF